MDFFERKTAKINSSYGSIGHFDRVELSLGFGVPHGHIQSSHFQRPCVLYGSCFWPSLGAFTSLTHTMQVYQLRFGHPVWRSLVTAVRILPNIGPPASEKNFSCCKYTWGKFWTADPQNLVAGAGPSQSFGHVGGSPLLQDKLNVTRPWSARGLFSL